MSEARFGSLGRRKQEVAGDEDWGDRLGSRSARAKSAQDKGSLVRQGTGDEAASWGCRGLNCQAEKASLDVISDRELRSALE